MAGGTNAALALFLKRLGGAAAGTFAVGSAGSLWIHTRLEHERDLQLIRLRNELPQLRADAVRGIEAADVERAALADEVAIGGEAMGRALTELWKERVRRWRDTAAHDELCGVLPWLYWHWARLGAFYELFADRFGRQNSPEDGGAYAEYEVVSLKMFDMAMALDRVAYPQTDRVATVAQTLAALTTAAPSDPLFQLLEGSVRHLSVPPLSAIHRAASDDVPAAIDAVAENPNNCPGGAQARAALRAVAEELRESARGALARGVVGATVALEAQRSRGEVAGEAAEGLLEKLSELGAYVESYALASQASEVLDAHLATLQLSFV